MNPELQNLRAFWHAHELMGTATHSADYAIAAARANAAAQSLRKLERERLAAEACAELARMAAEQKRSEVIA